MKMILTALLTLGLMGSAHATVEEMPVVAPGGFSNLSGGSQFVAAAAIGLIAVYAIQQSEYDCVIKKVAPLPGTNYANEKSVCTKN